MHDRAATGSNSRQGPRHGRQASGQPGASVEGPRGLSWARRIRLLRKQTPTGDPQVPPAPALPGNDGSHLRVFILKQCVTVGVAPPPEGTQQGANRRGPPSSHPHGHQEENPGHRGGGGSEACWEVETGVRPGLEREQQPGCVRDAGLSRGRDAQRQNIQVSSFFFSSQQSSTSGLKQQSQHRHIYREKTPLGLIFLHQPLLPMSPFTPPFLLSLKTMIKKTAVPSRMPFLHTLHQSNHLRSPHYLSLMLSPACCSQGKKIKQHHFNFGILVPRFNVTADGALSHPSIL